MQKSSSCLPRESNNSSVHPSSKEAFSLYDEAVLALYAGALNCDKLSSNTSYSNALRCHLLRRSPTRIVSWNDVLFAKLIHDVPHLSVSSAGTVTMSRSASTREQRVSNLKANVLVLINN
jgi:hypothetical protein